MGTEADVEEVVEIPIVKPKKVIPALPAPKEEPAPIFVPVRDPAREPVEIDR